MFAAHSHTPAQIFSVHHGDKIFSMVRLGNTLYLDRKLYLAAFDMNGELPDIMTALSLSLR